jgi:site-specific DNA-cytosine methylase
VNGLTHLDLCSGIGGFSLAAEWAGFQTVGIAEVNPYLCEHVLPYLFPGLPNYGDIRCADFSSVGNVCLLTAGYPCQPFSLAGERRGEADDRHLWPSVFRAVQIIRPTWVCCENVNGHVTLGLDRVLVDLESTGYSTQPLVIPAASVGAWHKRERVWILAHADRDEHQSDCHANQGTPSSQLSGISPDSHREHGNDRGYDSANVERKRQGETRQGKYHGELIPTPTAMTATGGAAMCKWGGSGARKKLALLFTPEEINGALNPDWVEWLMGYPIGRSASRRLATPSSRKLPTSSSRRSRKKPAKAE